MYGGNTKYHVNPYIQGTTVPCDKLQPVPARNNNLGSKVIRKFLAREGQAIHDDMTHIYVPGGSRQLQLNEGRDKLLHLCQSYPGDRDGARLPRDCLCAVQRRRDCGWPVRS